MNLLSRLLHRYGSSALYHGLKFADRNLWMSSRISAALYFRASWRKWLHPHAPAHPIKLWIHGASVGELEDLAAFFLSESALAAAGLNPPDVMITAASPSTQERLKKWRTEIPFAYCGPLPPDTSREAQAFLTKLHPENFLLSHNDFWPNLYWQWRAQKFSKNFFWYLKPRVWTASRAAAFASLNPIHIDRKTVGNLRQDRILSRIASALPLPHVLTEWNAQPQTAKPSILVGSCRIEDAQVIRALPKHVIERFDWVVIPHHSEDLAEIAQIQSGLPSTIKVIAKQGILVEAYRDFSLAWVGGGFSRSGLHNNLEALAWGVPVACGPNITPQIDTPLYLAQGCLQTFTSASDLERLLEPENFKKLQTQAKQFAQNLAQSGSTVEKLAKFLTRPR